MSNDNKLDLNSVPFDGQIFWYPSRHSRVADLLKRNLYEPEVTAHFKNILTSEMTFFDVGAHYGYYTLLAAKRVKKVVAFEPRSKAVRMLRLNIDANSHNNVIIAPFPLFRKSARGQVVLSQFVEDSSGNIRAHALDDLDYGIPDVIKVDVEGAECDVLEGALRTIKAHQPEIVVELHASGLLGTYGRSSECLQEVFSSVGYISEMIGRHGGEVFLVARAS